MEETWIHLAGSILKSGGRISFLPVDRGKRFHGTSKMNLVSLTLHGLQSFAVFLESVLTRMILFCAVLAGLSALGIVLALTLKLGGFATPGWMTAAIGALLGILLQTGTLALLALLLAISGGRGLTTGTSYDATRALQSSIVTNQSKTPLSGGNPDRDPRDLHDVV